MDQASVIARLTAALPHWRSIVQKAQNCTFEAVRHKIRQGTALSGDATRGALFGALLAKAKECEAIAHDLMFALVIEPPPPKVRKTRVPISQVKLILRRQFPTWGEMWKYGFPGGSIEHMRSLGIERDELTGQWFKIEQL